MKKIITAAIVISLLSSCMRQWVEDCPAHNKTLFTRQQGRR